jgi:aldehyde dehydrogenase (NAD+)
VEAAVSAAEAAQPGWAALSPQQRGLPMKKLADLLLAEKEELAQLDALSMGRPVNTFFDAYYAATHFSYFAEAGYAQGHTSLNTPGFFNVSLRQPYGVVAIIIPWNAPLVFFGKKIAPAIAAGNTVVLKSSEKGPLTSWKVSQWIEKCGFPPGVINVLSGLGNIAGQAMSAHMKIRCLSFTGSTRTGRAIQIASAQSNLKKVIFELGGKSPAIVFEDADLERAVQETEHSINWNSGQTCMANSRIYVQETIKDKFVEEFRKLAANRKLGDPTNGEINHGPQADEQQYSTVKKYIEMGKQSGKTVTEEAQVESGVNGALMVNPVVFVDQPEDSKVMKGTYTKPLQALLRQMTMLMLKL